MSLSKSVNWLSRSILFAGLSTVFLVACNPYKYTVKTGQDNFSFTLDSVLDQNYPFTGHKDIDWQSWTKKVEGIIDSDFGLEDYLAIRALVYEIPDAKFQIRSQRDDKLMEQTLGGYIGFDMSRFNGGLVKVIHVDSVSVAFKNGLRVGDQVLGWNGSPIGEVLNSFPLAWGPNPSTTDFYRIQQNHFLSRGPIGMQVELFYQNRTGNAKGIKVQFEKDEISFYPKYLSNKLKKQGASTLEIKDSVAVWTIHQFNASVLSLFYQKILSNQESLAGLVIDLRFCQEGYDQVAADLASFFVKEEVLYEETIVRLADSNEWANLGHIHVEPNMLQWNKPTIVLVGPLTAGSAEGICRVIDPEEHIVTMGHWATAGSYSYPGGIIQIRKSFSLSYPIGMSIDEHGEVLIESTGRYGGIQPELTLPAPYEVLLAESAGYDILVNEAISHILLLKD